MKVHELILKSPTERKRVGRGIGSGYGKTAGRGTKGQNARTGGGVRPGFEGGQNPLAKRLPKKRGFASLNPTTYQVINLAQLNSFKDGSKIGTETLVKAGLIKKANLPVKLLASGELSKKLTITVQSASAAAKAAVTKSGGSLDIIELIPSRELKKAQG